MTVVLRIEITEIKGEKLPEALILMREVDLLEDMPRESEVEYACIRMYDDLVDEYDLYHSDEVCIVEAED